MTSNYWISTQCNHWILNHTQVAIARAEDEQYATSPEECTALRIWLINCICMLTKRLSLRQRITATSIVFFHRFYSCSPANSFSSTDPALVATACVYVASKVEETPVHIRVVVQEAAKLWAELGHWKFPNEVSSLAEMEFYLLEDLHFHMVVYHPYRSLVAIHTASGKGATKLDTTLNASSTWATLFGSIGNNTNSSGGNSNGSNTSTTTPQSTGNAAQASGTELGVHSTSNFMDPDLAYGSPGAGLSGRKADNARAIENGDIEKIKQLDKQSQLRVMQEMIDERHRMFLYGGDDGMPLPRLEELDDQVLQMAWFVLNDAYRTDVVLLYPPHLIAVAAIFLAIVLHDPSRERMVRSKRWMDDRRERYRVNLLYPKSVKAKMAKHNENSNTSHSGTESGSLATAKPDSNTTSTPPVSGASPPKPVLANAAAMALSPVNTASPTQSMPVTQGSKGPLRGLASLPPRPSHLPMKPMSNVAATPSHANTPSLAHQSSPQISASPGGSGASPAGGLTSTDNKGGHSSSAPLASTAISDLTPAIAAAAELNACNPPIPPPDAMTFLAALNIDLNAVAEIVQEMLSLYDIWHRISTAGPASSNGSGSGDSASSKADEEDPTASINIGDGPDMFRRLTKMRERRREDLLRNGSGL